MAIDDIPTSDLLSILKERAWGTAGRPEFKRQGYSYELTDDTAIRDINYRNAPLYPTREKALFAYWEKFHNRRRAGR